MTKLALAIIFLSAVVALIFGVAERSLGYLVVSALSSLTIIAVGVGAGGWKVLNPFRGKARVTNEE